MGLEWLKPAAFLGSHPVRADRRGRVLAGASCIIDKITPYDLWEEIVEKQNVALGAGGGGDEPGHLHHRRRGDPLKRRRP